jgi:SAM-dependent methyltransferase
LTGPGRALDLASGYGRNALYLARSGWNVTAIDLSGDDVHALRDSASNEGLPIDARIRDLERDPLDFDDESFDLIAIIHYFQPSLFPDVKRILRRGGVIATSAKMTGRFAARAGELSGYFEGWELIHESENGMTAELITRRQ